MASNCIDLNDKITQNLRGSSRLPTFDSDGAYTFQQVNKLAEDFVNSIVEDQETNPIKLATNKFGEFAFYDSLTNLNKYLNDSDLSSYPDLSGRYQKGALGGIEYADFLDEFAYSANGVNNGINNNSLSLLSQLDNYYKSSFSQSILGGFCTSIQGVFGAIDAFFSLVNAVQGLVADALSFIGNLGQSIIDFGEKVAAQGLITVIKEQIVKVIESVFGKVLFIIEQFGKEMEQLFENGAEFINKGVIQRAQKIKEDAEQILDDDNKKTLQEKIGALIDYAVSLFERPTLAEIQYLVLRFCAFISNVEALVNEVKRPATTYSLKYQAVVNRLSRVSASASAAAIAAGGIRYTEERRKKELEEMEAEWTAGITETELSPSQNPQYNPTDTNIVNPSPTTTPDGNQASPPADSVNTVTPEQAGNIDTETGLPLVDFAAEELKIQKPWNTPDGLPPQNDRVKPKEILGVESYKTIKEGNSTKFAFKSFDDGAAAWYELDSDFKRHLYKIQEAVGKKLIISSAWRSVQTNARYGGSKSSYHLYGFAVDISQSTPLTAKDQQKLKEAVERYGYQLLGGPQKLGGYDGGGHWHIEPGDIYTKALANAAIDDISDLQREEQTPGFGPDGEPLP